MNGKYIVCLFDRNVELTVIRTRDGKVVKHFYNAKSGRFLKSENKFVIIYDHGNVEFYDPYSWDVLASLMVSTDGALMVKTNDGFYDFSIDKSSNRRIIRGLQEIHSFDSYGISIKKGILKEIIQE